MCVFQDGELREHRELPNIDMTKRYTMVESEAFFEAYRHVLAGLQGKKHLMINIL